jgi:hypothetical protein
MYEISVENHKMGLHIYYKHGMKEYRIPFGTAIN